MFSEIELERVKLAFVEKVSNEMLGAIVDIKDVGDDFIRNLTTIKIQGYLWGESGKSQTIRYPATWRDAFKEQWFPKWLLERYPVVYKEHRIDLKTLYPNFRVSMPSESHVLKYETYERLIQ